MFSYILIALGIGMVLLWLWRRRVQESPDKHSPFEQSRHLGKADHAGHSHSPQVAHKAHGHSGCCH